MKHLRILLLLAGLFLIASPAREASALSLSNPTVATAVAAEGTAALTTEVRYRRHRYSRAYVFRRYLSRRPFYNRRHSRFR